MVKTYKTEGVVLKRVNFKETDRLLTVFTKHYGKLHLLAKGIRKLTSKKAASLEPFVWARFFIARGRNLDIVLETEIIDSFNEIKLDLKKIGMAYQVCEVVEKLSPEEQVNRSLFELITAELNNLRNSSTYSVEGFCLKLLWDLGYLPKDKMIPDAEINLLLEEVLEGKLKSKQLLTKIESLL